jgi:hypothetical protein
MIIWLHLCYPAVLEPALHKLSVMDDSKSRTMTDAQMIHNVTDSG